MFQGRGRRGEQVVTAAPSFSCTAGTQEPDTKGLGSNVSCASSSEWTPRLNCTPASPRHVSAVRPPVRGERRKATALRVVPREAASRSPERKRLKATAVRVISRAAHLNTGVCFGRKGVCGLEKGYVPERRVDRRDPQKFSARLINVRIGGGGGLARASAVTAARSAFVARSLQLARVAGMLLSMLREDFAQSEAKRTLSSPKYQNHKLISWRLPVDDTALRELLH